MRALSRALAWLAVLAAASTAIAQVVDPRPPLRLATGERVFEPGVDPELTKPPTDGADSVHVIVQFYGSLSAADRRLVDSHGVRLFDPVALYGYYALVPQALLRAAPPLTEPPYRAVVPILPDYKIAPWMRESIPEHARRGDNGAALSIQFHGDVPERDQVAILRSLGLVTEARLPFVNGFQAVAELDPDDPLDRLQAIAAMDAVRWLEPIPRPATRDNDELRGAAGVAADAVTPDTSYGVNGGGVTIAQWEPGVADPTHGDLEGRVELVDTGPVDGHATHVAATAIGSGALSDDQGGSVEQWRGVAVGAKIRGYNDASVQDEYYDAATNGASLSTNSWGITHCHELPDEPCYTSMSQFLDGVVSGRRSDGLPTSLAHNVLVVASAGNEGAPERHADDVVPNGRYDPGEAIYVDLDDSGTVSPGDLWKRVGTHENDRPLIDFHMNERHDEHISAGGIFDSAVFDPLRVGEIIYRDVDGSGRVSAGDIRLVPTPFGPAPTTVTATDADALAKTFLRQFRLWGNTREPNSAKNTLVVGNYLNDGGILFRDSSRGPTPDGRVKPDLVAPGSQAGGDGGITSAVPTDTYVGFSGTSHSTPAVTGVAALLMQWYRAACRDVAPRPATLRALLLHSAIDLTVIPNVAGAFVGPDFAYGYGKVNAPGALGAVPYHVEGTARLVDVGAAATQTYALQVGTTQDLKVTLAWDDPPWLNAAPQEAAGASLLQNDLDLELVAPNGTVFTPWRLDPANPFAPAVASAGHPGGGPIPESARDRRNTVEQVVVPKAAPGTWTIRIVAARLDLPDQDFTVVSDFLAPQAGACNAAPAADVWLRDNVSDTGAAPSTGVLWLSPDVWNRVQADGGTAHENPVFGGADNALYARVANRSGETAKATAVDVWIAPAATGLAWPSSFSYVGRLHAPNLLAGESRIVGPLHWSPPNPNPSDHFCFYVRAVSPQDPIAIAEGSDVGYNAAQSNNIAWRNVNVVALNAARSVMFLTRNTEPEPGRFDIRFVFPEALLRDVRVEVGLSEALHRRWIEAGGRGSGFRRTELAEALRERLTERRDIVPAVVVDAATVELEGVPYDAGEAQAVRLTFYPRSTRRAEYPVDVVQRVRGRDVGGIRYVVRTGEP